MIKKILLFTFCACLLTWSQGTTISLMTSQSGSVHLPDGSTHPHDFVIAVFSDVLVNDPVLAKHNISFPTADVAPMAGCLSVASVSLHSGVATLEAPGQITFGCSDVPENVRAYEWQDNEWRPVGMERSEEGLVSISFQNLTTYALFPDSPTKEDPNLSQI